MIFGAPPALRRGRIRVQGGRDGGGPPRPQTPQPAGTGREQPPPAPHALGDDADFDSKDTSLLFGRRPLQAHVSARELHGELHLDLWGHPGCHLSVTWGYGPTVNPKLSWRNQQAHPAAPQGRGFVPCLPRSSQSRPCASSWSARPAGPAAGRDNTLGLDTSGDSLGSLGLGAGPGGISPPEPPAEHTPQQKEISKNRDYFWRQIDGTELGQCFPCRKKQHLPIAKAIYNPWE